MAPRPQDELVDALAQTTFTVLPVLTRIAAEHDLSLTQLRMLGILRDRRPRIVDLAAGLGLDKSSVSGLIDRAAARGLVRRVRDASDGRVALVELTDEGRALTARGEAAVAAALRPLLDAVDADRQRALARDIHGLLEHLPRAGRPR